MWYAAVCLEDLGCTPPPEIGAASLIGFVSFRIRAFPETATVVIDTVPFWFDMPFYFRGLDNEYDPPYWPGPILLCSPTAVEEKEGGQGISLIKKVAPNPFKEHLSISYQLDEECFVDVSVCNAGGRLVRRLFSGLKNVGEHTLSWDGRDKFGRPLAPGVYFLILKAGTKLSVRKICLKK
jgi:hypothetical protein